MCQWIERTKFKLQVFSFQPTATTTPRVAPAVEQNMDARSRKVGLGLIIRHIIDFVPMCIEWACKVAAFPACTRSKLVYYQYENFV